MKITINFTRNEIDASVNVARDLGMENDAINNMINDFELSGTNLSAKYLSHDKVLHFDINEKIITKILNKFRPMISMVTGLVKMVMGLFDDL